MIGTGRIEGKRKVMIVVVIQADPIMKMKLGTDIADIVTVTARPGTETATVKEVRASNIYMQTVAMTRDRQEGIGVIKMIGAVEAEVGADHRNL